MLHPPQNDKTFCVDVSYFVQLVHYLGKLIILSSEPGSPRQTLEVNLYQTSITRGFGNRFFFGDILLHKSISNDTNQVGHLLVICDQLLVI